MSYNLDECFSSVNCTLLASNIMYSMEPPLARSSSFTGLAVYCSLLYIAASAIFTRLVKQAALQRLGSTKQHSWEKSDYHVKNMGKQPVDWVGWEAFEQTNPYTQTQRETVSALEKRRKTMNNQVAVTELYNKRAQIVNFRRMHNLRPQLHEL